MSAWQHVRMYKKSALTAGSERVWLNDSAICFHTNKIYLGCWEHGRDVMLLHSSYVCNFIDPDSNRKRNVTPQQYNHDLFLWIFVMDHMCSDKYVCPLLPTFSHSPAQFQICRVTDYWTLPACTGFTAQLLLSPSLTHTQSLSCVRACAKSLQFTF